MGMLISAAEHVFLSSRRPYHVAIVVVAREVS